MASVKQNAPKNRNLIVGIVLVAVIFVATLMVYTVDVTEYAVVTQFGDPVAVYDNPGLKVKLPDRKSVV